MTLLITNFYICFYNGICKYFNSRIILSKFSSLIYSIINFCICLITSNCNNFTITTNYRCFNTIIIKTCCHCYITTFAINFGICLNNSVFFYINRFSIFYITSILIKSIINCSTLRITCQYNSIIYCINCWCANSIIINIRSCYNL